MSDREIMLKHIENRMETLWDKLPDAQRVLDGKATPEEYAVTGAYKELESVYNFIEKNCPKSPFEVLSEKIKIENAPDCVGEPFDVSEIIFEQK